MERQPLVITHDQDLLHHVARIAAATGTEVRHSLAVPARADWRAAGVVVIDVDLLDACVASGLAHRDGLVLLTRGAPTDHQWSQCLRLGVGQAIGVAGLGDLSAHRNDGAEEQLMEVFAAAVGEAPGDGRTVAVVGACGGAGASVLAAATAVIAHGQQRSVVLVDADRWGAGLDVLLGVESAAGVRWPDLAASAGRLDHQMLRAALPGPMLAGRALPVLGFDVARSTDLPVPVAQVVAQSVRRSGDLAVLDLPRVPTPVGDRLLELADLAVLVVPATVRGCFAAQRLLPHLIELNGHVQLVVRGPSEGGLGADDIANALAVPLLHAMRPAPDRHLQGPGLASLTRSSPLGRAALAVAAAVTDWSTGVGIAAAPEPVQVAQPMAFATGNVAPQGISGGQPLAPSGVRR